MEKIRLRAGALIIKDDAVLLSRFKNEATGKPHYNLPAGGSESYETLKEAVKREAKEETCVEIEVGPVAFVYEYQPTKSSYIYGDTHWVDITFHCSLKEGSVPKMPEKPDPSQTGVEWIAIDKLGDIDMYPAIAEEIISYHKGKAFKNYIEEHEIQVRKSSS